MAASIVINGDENDIEHRRGVDVTDNGRDNDVDDDLDDDELADEVDDHDVR